MDFKNMEYLNVSYLNYYHQHATDDNDYLSVNRTFWRFISDVIYVRENWIHVAEKI